jgi:hypothetical protein
MWLVTGVRAYHLEPEAGCYRVWHGATDIGLVCPVACDLEYRAVLYGPSLAWSPRCAARRLIAERSRDIQPN